MKVTKIVCEEILKKMNGCEINSLFYEKTVGIKDDKVISEGKQIDVLNSNKKVIRLWKELIEQLLEENNNMKTKTLKIQIDENQKNCVVAGLILLQLEMNDEMKKKPSDNARNQWLTEQILMMDYMIKAMDENF